MDIIVGPNHLDLLGVTETFVMTLVEESGTQGYAVGIHTLRPSIVSNYLQSVLE